jgi:hypothetical protein
MKGSEAEIRHWHRRWSPVDREYNVNVVQTTSIVGIWLPPAIENVVASRPGSRISAMIWTEAKTDDDDASLMKPLKLKTTSPRTFTIGGRATPDQILKCCSLLVDSCDQESTHLIADSHTHIEEVDASLSEARVYKSLVLQSRARALVGSK